MIRKQILEQAINLTAGDRNKSYGPPSVNLTCLAEMINAYLKAQGKEVTLSAADAAMIMVLTKASRVAVNVNHDDNYVDGAAYFAIAGECVKEKAQNVSVYVNGMYPQLPLEVKDGKIQIGGKVIEE